MVWSSRSLKRATWTGRPPEMGIAQSSPTLSVSAQSPCSGGTWKAWKGEGTGDGERVGLAAAWVCVGVWVCVGDAVGAGVAVQAASRIATARDRFFRSGRAFGVRLPEPSHHDLLGSIDLLVDLPSRANQLIDVLLVFPNVGVLADHRFALTWASGSQFARRERAADLRPQRRSRLRLGSRRRFLDPFVDRVALRRKAWPRGGRGLIRTRRHIPPAEATEDRGILDLLRAVRASAHGS